MLVLLVMALAGILGYAMLSASSVQATASSNGVAAAVARAQAESGIHLAMYYLLNPANAPASFVPPCTVTTTFATTGAPVTTMPGSVTIQVGSAVNHCYSVISTGSSGSATGGGEVTRTIRAEIQVGTPLQIDQAGAFDSAITVGANATFSSSNPNAPAIASTGAVVNSGTISGNVTAASFSGTLPTGGSVTSASTNSPAPTNSNYVNDYTQPYLYQGTLYNPVSIGSSVSAPTSLGPTPTNPLGIYYSSGNLSVSKSLTINGTLEVKGTLTNTSSIALTPLTSQANTYLPALVVDQKVTMSGHTASLNATGVVYVGTGITGVGTNSSTNITVNGALLITGGAINNTYTGTASVIYNSTYTNIPNFDVTDWDSSSSVQIISWSE